MAGFALAAAVLGMGIVLHVLGWTALSSEAGGNCGRFKGPCPQGLTGVLLLAFGCTFAGLGGLAFVDSALEKRRALPRRRRWSAIIAVVGVLAGAWPGALVYDGLRGQFLEVRWSVATDRLYLNELSPTDGAVTATLPVRGEWWVHDVDLRKVSDRYAVIAPDGTKEPPVVMVG